MGDSNSVVCESWSPYRPTCRAVASVGCSTYKEDGDDEVVI